MVIFKDLHSYSSTYFVCFIMNFIECLVFFKDSLLGFIWIFVGGLWEVFFKDSLEGFIEKFSGVFFKDLVVGFIMLL